MSSAGYGRERAGYTAGVITDDPVLQTLVRLAELTDGEARERVFEAIATRRRTLHAQGHAPGLWEAPSAPEASETDDGWKPSEARFTPAPKDAVPLRFRRAGESRYRIAPPRP